MAKGLGILIAPAKASKRSMYDAGDDESPESERESAESGSMLEDLKTLLGDADEDQLEAFKALVKACFDEYEGQPHKEGPHIGEEEDEE